MGSADEHEQNLYQSFPEGMSPPGSGNGNGMEPGDPSAFPHTILGSGSPNAAAEARASRRFRWIAVLVGYGSDYLLTEVLDRVFWLLLGLHVASHGGAEPSQTMVLAWISFLGSSSSVFGGFVCGLVAKHSEVRHGFVQAALGFTIFLLQVWRSADRWGLPTWYYVVTIPAVTIATLSGAWLAGERRRKLELRHA